MARKKPEGERYGDGVLTSRGHDPHECVAPNWRDVEQHAVWQCDCGRRWSLESCDWHRVRSFLGFKWIGSEITGSGPSVNDPIIKQLREAQEWSE